jgi:Uma2 family endonuclease
MSSLTSTIPKTRSSAAAPSRLRRITVDEYERMIRAGALDDPKRVELIGGYLVQKMAKSAEHGYATKKLIKALEALLPAGWTWRTEQPVRIPDFDEPEPDVSMVRGTDEDYAHRIPVPDDVGLVIEAS